MLNIMNEEITVLDLLPHLPKATELMDTGNFSGYKAKSQQHSTKREI